jgi:DNA polymerase
MFIDPILCIDGGVLTEHIQNIRNRKEELLASSNVERTELMSNPKYAVLLENLGVSPPRKISKTTGKETFAFAKTDEGHKKLLEHPDIQVQTLVSARMGVKTTLEETRSERLLGISSRGLLPIPLKYYAAHTGRWGGDDKLNMQNLPARGSNKTIKDAILAPPGHTLINCDSSQIEARVIAWLAGQKDILSDFASGKDVYKQMATKIYQVDINHVTKEQRQVAKAVVLGCGFGMGPVRFKIQFKSDSGIDIPKAECEKIIRTYRRQCERITNLWKDGDSCLNAIIDDAEATFGVVPCIQFKPNLSGFILPNGLTQTYRGLTRKMEGKYVEFEYPTRNSVIGIYGGSLTENLVQAIARCIIAEQMIAISRRYRVVLTVHDAVLCCVPDEQAEAARAYMETCMCTNPEWATGLPLNCESTMGKSYGSCR